MSDTSKLDQCSAVIAYRTHFYGFTQDVAFAETVAFQHEFACKGLQYNANGYGTESKETYLLF